MEEPADHQRSMTHLSLLLNESEVIDSMTLVPSCLVMEFSTTFYSKQEELCMEVKVDVTVTLFYICHSPFQTVDSENKKTPEGRRTLS